MSEWVSGWVKDMADRHTPQLQSASSSAAEDRAVRKLETELQRVLARKVPLEELLTQYVCSHSLARLLTLSLVHCNSDDCRMVVSA